MRGAARLEVKNDQDRLDCPFAVTMKGPRELTPTPSTPSARPDPSNGASLVWRRCTEYLVVLSHGVGPIAQRFGVLK